MFSRHSSSLLARIQGHATASRLSCPEDHHIVHVTATRNNTMATLTDASGNALVWASAGTCGLKKSARGTSDAGYQTILQLAEKAEKKNVQLRGVEGLGWNIKRITDVTPIRHGGCRPPRREDCKGRIR
ncbi:hypothetical protein BC829DRAFT_379758 [Chytridium lagenaria]|nr:hypothetical protein BC829DRAFT_379758 [Chytridium lagenaria]